jgi:lysophospholipase L1-like esterase
MPDRVYLFAVPLMRPSVARRGMKRLEGFREEPPSPGRVVFLGDSITQRGDWAELFPNLQTLNRGIDGNTTEDVLARLDQAIDHPAAVSLLIGTNDLHSYPRRLKDPEGILQRLEEIVRRIRTAAPEAPLFVNSMTPRTSYFAKKIRALNVGYRQVAERNGAVYVDLWPAMADEHGALIKEFTFDSLHLTPEGYRAWAGVLRPYLSTKESS